MIRPNSVYPENNRIVQVILKHKRLHSAIAILGIYQMVIIIPTTQVKEDYDKRPKKCPQFHLSLIFDAKCAVCAQTATTSKEERTTISI